MAITSDILKKHFGFNDDAVISGILNDPGQVSRYEREYQGITNPGSTQISGGLFDRQKAEENAFLNRYQGVIGGQESISAMADRIGGELNLPNLRQSAFDLSNTLKNIPTVENQIGQQVGISAPRLQKRIAVKQGELAPSVSDAVSQAQFAEGELGQRLGYAVQDQLKQLKPLEMEASMLSDRLAREVTGYGIDKKNELDILLNKMNRGYALEDWEKGRAAMLADVESAFEKQKQLISFNLAEQNKYKDSSTGNPLSYLSGNTQTNTQQTIQRQPLQSLWDGVGA
jgi:hypothetical protein